MSYVTHKNRTSAYKFTTTDINDSAIAELKEHVAMLNNRIRKANKSPYTTKQKPTLRIRIRPRGPRNGNIYDTPIFNATHFDVYVNEVIKY